MLDHLDWLPEPQRAGLGTAFGLRAGPPPDLFLVGLAVLNLLSAVAERRPLVCIVDDAQWLDLMSAMVVTFVARRLTAESVALVFAAREDSDEQGLRGLPELPVPGLSDADARTLLDSVIPGPLDDQVRDRIIAETRGNPLALLELPRALTPAELAFGLGIRPAMDAGAVDGALLTSRIERGFLHRLERLPAATRLLLLTAAVEPLGDVLLLWRAVEQLGIGPDAAAPAEAAGLIELGLQVRFRHPLVRSAAVRAAVHAALRDVHRVLADVTDPDRDPDRRAWHRACAAAGPDEAVAVELERSADRALARGGIAAATLLTRAAELTRNPARRGARALDPAQARLDAGQAEAVPDLLATAELGAVDPLQHARIERLRARTVVAQKDGNDGPVRLLAAARLLEPLDPAAARETYLEALSAALHSGQFGGELSEVARAARPVPEYTTTPTTPDLLLDGLATRFTDGYAASLPPLRAALAASVHERDLRWLRLAAPLADELWDDTAWHLLTDRTIQQARERRVLAALPIALVHRAAAHIFAGEFAAASVLLGEADSISEATGQAAVGVDVAGARRLPRPVDRGHGTYRCRRQGRHHAR